MKSGYTNNSIGLIHFILHKRYGTFYYNKKTGKSGSRHRKAANANSPAADPTANTILHSKR